MRLCPIARDQWDERWYAWPLLRSVVGSSVEPRAALTGFLARYIQPLSPLPQTFATDAEFFCQLGLGELILVILYEAHEIVL